MKLTITTLLILILLNACQAVQTKIDEKTKKEQEQLSVYIGKNIEETFIDFGQPFTENFCKLQVAQ